MISSIDLTTRAYCPANIRMTRLHKYLFILAENLQVILSREEFMRVYTINIYAAIFYR